MVRLANGHTLYVATEKPDAHIKYSSKSNEKKTHLRRQKVLALVKFMSNISWNIFTLMITAKNVFFSCSCARMGNPNRNENPYCETNIIEIQTNYLTVIYGFHIDALFR